jgi:hypothetical protein
MGAPAIAIFCINGHLLISTAHHEIIDDDQIPTQCRHCGSHQLKTVYEWGDEPLQVPFKPKEIKEIISESKIKVVLDDGSVIMARPIHELSVFDVSALFEGYRDPVKFTQTGRYGCGKITEDDVYTIAEFHEFCRSGAFVDYDGFGHPVKDKLANPDITIKPSTRDEIPSDATHIVWYNR